MWAVQNQSSRGHCRLIKSKSRAEQSSSEQCKADIWVGIMHVCLWLHLPGQDCKLGLRRLQLETALLASSGSTQFSSVQTQYKTGSCSGGVSERRPFSEKGTGPLLAFLVLLSTSWHWIKLGTGIQSGSNYLLPDNTCSGAELVLCPAG